MLQVHDGTYTPADQFLKDPDSLCSTVTWKDEEDRVIWVYRIQVRQGHVGVLHPAVAVDIPGVVVAVACAAAAPFARSWCLL